MFRLKPALFLILFASGCVQNERSETTVRTQDTFFANLSALCDAHFVGSSTYPEVPDHPLVGTELRNHISECTDNTIRIELLRDGDYWHGAWVIEKRPDGLHLFHDHLGEVRTMQDLLASGDAHGYGGYATNDGTEFRQYFAADDTTAAMLPEAATNVWMMELNPETGTFVYYLERHGQPRFRAVMNKL